MNHVSSQKLRDRDISTLLETWDFPIVANWQKCKSGPIKIPAAKVFAEFSKNGRKVAELFCCVLHIKPLAIYRNILVTPWVNSTFLLT
jgi:hypothetical protein